LPDLLFARPAGTTSNRVTSPPAVLTITRMKFVRGRLITAFALVASWLLVSASAAFGAPANDNFAEAQDLGSSLPQVVPSTSVGATEEADDPRTLSAPRHSVWFHWEAPSTEPVAIDTCHSEFATILAVFTGSGLGGLEEVGEDTNTDGRYCSVATGVAFRATAGTVYSIMVAGNGFHFPEAPAPATEGDFELRLAAIPKPPNDDFAHPIPIETSATFWVGGEFVSYDAWSDGFTWNATKEPGEPDHAEDPGGASVWYRWTAPRSGPTELGACDSPSILLGLYTGDVVDALTPVSLESRPMPCFVDFAAVSGKTYRIAVDGKFDADIGMAAMATFGIHVSMHGSPQSVESTGAEANQLQDKTEPNTRLFKQVLRRKLPIYVFHFNSNELGSTFRCKLDKGRLVKCHSPLRLRHLKPGSHTLRVYAVDAAGNRDRSAAVAHFTVTRSKHRSRT
jgi:hypothetical protein